LTNSDECLAGEEVVAHIGQTRAAARVSVEETLDRLPEKFTRRIYAQKCDAVYQHVFESYWDDGHSVYERAA